MQTSCGPHPACCSMVIGGAPFLGAQRQIREEVYSLSSSAKFEREWTHTSSPPLSRLSEHTNNCTLTLLHLTFPTQLISILKPLRTRHCSVHTSLPQRWNQRQNMPELCLTLIWFAPFSYNALRQNALFNLHPLIFGLPPLGWLCSVTLNRYSWWKHSFIVA